MTELALDTAAELLPALASAGKGDEVLFPPDAFQRLRIENGRAFYGGSSVPCAARDLVLKGADRAASLAGIRSDAPGLRLEAFRIDPDAGFRGAVTKAGQFPVDLSGDGQSMAGVFLDGGDHVGEDWSLADWRAKAPNGVRAYGSYFRMEECLVRATVRPLVNRQASQDHVLQWVVFDGFGDDVRAHPENWVAIECIAIDARQVSPGAHLGFGTTFADNLPGTHKPDQNGVRRFVTLLHCVTIGSRIPGDSRASPLQTGGLQDGSAEEFHFEGNLCITGGYRGMGIGGATNCRVIDNLVIRDVAGLLSPDNPQKGPAKWTTLSVSQNRFGQPNFDVARLIVPTGCTVRGNIANVLNIQGDPAQNDYGGNVALPVDQWAQAVPGLDRRDFTPADPKFGFAAAALYWRDGVPPWQWALPPAPVPVPVPVPDPAPEPGPVVDHEPPASEAQPDLPSTDDPQEPVNETPENGQVPGGVSENPAEPDTSEPVSNPDELPRVPSPLMVQLALAEIAEARQRLYAAEVLLSGKTTA